MGVFKLAGLGAGDGLGVVEGDVADGGARGGGHGAGEQVVAVGVLELGEHELVELVAGDAGEGLVHGDEPLVDQLGGHAEGCRGGALADAGLQEPQLATKITEEECRSTCILKKKSRR